MKNLRLLETRLTRTNINKLKPINPLAMVKALYGIGVKPAKKSILSHARKPCPIDRLYFNFSTLFSYP